jgi:membrane complex biogenesis BtpA family protein
VSYQSLFGDRKPIIGMVHLLALPGAPAFGGDIDAIYTRALADADALQGAGVDGLIVENFGDEPYYVGEPSAAQLALMAAITREVRGRVYIPVGVNVQFNAWEAEIAVAHAARADFVRVEVFVDTVVSAQGMVQPCSAQITRYRTSLGAKNLLLIADVQTKYTTNLLPQSIAQSAKDAQAAGADALIVTGAGTGQATPLQAVAEARSAVKIPVLVGSGTTAENALRVLEIADGAIVGSSLKHGGDAANAVSAERAAAFMRAARGKQD